LAKLRKEAEELAKTKKRLLAVQHEAEIQKQKAEIAKLQEELRAIKAKQSPSFNQPSPNILFPTSPISLNAMSFSPSPLRTPPLAVTPSLTLLSLALRTMTSTPYAQDLGIPSLPCLKKFRSPHGHKHTGQSHSLDSQVNPIPDNS
jgi:hypothetical protein